MIKSPTSRSSEKISLEMIPDISMILEFTPEIIASFLPFFVKVLSIHK
ncbi:MAG: hypothetical protein HYT46_00945 [Candidatus Vogelbacteria bacterium]|nr:hypothetical protein [Candidatus Vogelbacteria bacterium]